LISFGARPRCDGPRTVPRIRADQRLQGLKGFAISATSPAELVVPQGPGGVDAWFPRPLNPRKLWQAMEQFRATAPHNGVG
jgi:hypothetical protein